MKQTAISSSAFGMIQSGARISLALLILLLPKCGLCLVVYFNVFSILGISITKYFPFFLPALTGLLCLNLIIGFVKAKRSNDYTGWLLSVAGSLLLVINKIWLTSPILSWIAISMLIISSVMQIRASRKVCSRSFL